MDQTKKEELNYLLDNMVFSFSNIQAYATCPRMWELKYVECAQGESNIYAKFGTCCHNIMQEYTNGNIPKANVADKYNEQFAQHVDDCPPDFMNDQTFEFYERGLEYFEYETESSVVERMLKLYGKKYHRYEVSTEHYFEYEMPSNGRKFCGYIDLLIFIYNSKNKLQDIIVVDHKSGESPINKRNGNLKSSGAEKLEQYKRQLYLYSDYINYEYKMSPDSIALNYIKDKNILRFPFDKQEQENTLQWISETIEAMYNTECFDMTGSYFFCRNICEYRNGGC